MNDNMEYDWNGVEFPPFAPVRDQLSPLEEEFAVELLVTCFPYAREGGFDENAFPEQLRHLGLNGNTKFWLTARMDDGMPCLGLSWEEACDAADALNDRHAEELFEAASTWNWEAVSYELDKDDLVFWK